MPKPYTFPTLFNEVKSVSIPDLRKWGYLEPNRWQTGTITWSRQSNKTGSIGIEVNTRADEPYLVLNYNYGDKPIRYTIQLVSVPSNIGKGVVWYFLCPYIKKRCRVLYSVGELFLHREACTGYMYEKQTYSEKNRQLIRTFEKAFVADKVYEELYSKHFKKTYADKPTKRYLKLMQKIKLSRSYSLEEKERLFLI